MILPIVITLLVSLLLSKSIEKLSLLSSSERELEVIVDFFYLNKELTQVWDFFLRVYFSLCQDLGHPSWWETYSGLTSSHNLSVDCKTCQHTGTFFLFPSKMRSVHFILYVSVLLACIMCMLCAMGIRIGH